MNKPLTVEELKTLKVRDWVYFVFLKIPLGFCAQIIKISENSIIFSSEDFPVSFKDYGENWVCYKNREQAKHLFK